MPTKENERIVIQAPVFESIDNTTYNIILHNDDWTPMPYVVLVLMTVFDKTNHESTSIAWQAHRNGSAVIETTGYEEATKKVEAVNVVNQNFGANLKVTMQQA